MQAPPRPSGTTANATQSSSIAHQRALIPPTRIEFPTQRLYAVSLFILLQSLKIYDVLSLYWASYPEQHGGNMFKWFLLDGLYMISLWIVQIPWLQFSGFKTAFLLFLMLSVDAFLFTLPSIALSGALMKAFFGDVLGQQISVSRGKLVNVKDVVLNSSHILGRHTVHILPYGTAQLNPSDEGYCISPHDADRKEIYIPIILNNTIPRTITLSRYDFETTLQSDTVFSGRDILRATEIGSNKQGLESYYIRVTKPGAYQLKNIISKDGLDVRLRRKHAFVFTCPAARFKPIQATDYCRGEKDSLELEVTGVPPLKVEYVRRVQDSQTSLKLDRLQPDDFHSPLIRMGGSLRNAEPVFFDPTEHESYAWGATQHLAVQMNLTFSVSGEYAYQLVNVVDGAGNEVTLADSSTATYTVHDHPTVQFQCSATDPVKLLIGTDATQLPMKFQGTAPWKLTYDFVGEDAGASPERKSVDLDSSTQTLRAAHPGEYQLVSVSDRHCKGNVLFPSTCQVVQPPLPSVILHKASIPSECAGDSEIGMKFTAELFGTPPFNLNYRVLKKTGRKSTVVEQKRERIERSRHTFTYLPSSSGEYIYEFTSLDDRNYKNRNTEIQPIVQTVHPQPDARFTRQLQSTQTIRTCMGENITLDVDLSGSGPFTLYWMFARQMYSATVEDNKYTIVVPPLETSGRHVVSLQKIQDAHGCVKELDTRDIIIDVRRDRPTAFFYTEDRQEGQATVAEGEVAELPLRLTGEGPWKLKYRNIEKDGKSVRNTVIRDPNARLTVKDVGHYELVGVEDAICKGDALPPRYHVQWFDKPHIFLSEDQAQKTQSGVYERAPVCQGFSDAIDVQFSGQGPFYSVYEQYRLGEHRGSSMLLGTDEISSGLSKARVSLQTKDSGKFRYVFTKISDQRYTQPVKITPLTLEQVVYATPSLKFSSRSRRKHSVCVGDSFSSNDMGPLEVELTGEAPFSIHVGLKHQSEVYGKTIFISDIKSHKFRLELDEEVVLPGRYEIQLLDVRDAHGCDAVASGPESTLTVEALDIAIIVPTESCAEHCVGDTLEYSLSGVGPFTVSYQFNGHEEKIKAPTSRLTMLADKAGNMTIVSVGDQRNMCRSFPKEMTKIVHEVPSSRVSGGKELVENIREGDMVQVVVDLLGTPPFDFEWQRSEAIWDNYKKRYFKGHVLESHTVHNVDGHRYYINTSTEGIIEVTRIKDRYCQYP